MRRRELFNSLASSFNKKEEQEQVIRLPYNEDKSLFSKSAQVVMHLVLLCVKKI